MPASLNKVRHVFRLEGILAVRPSEPNSLNRLLSKEAALEEWNPMAVLEWAFPDF